MIRFNFKSIALLLFLLFASLSPSLGAGSGGEILKVDWSFKGLTGKFDRASLQRGFQVYKEVCSSCHSMQYLSYRNLGEPGGPEFSEQEVKAIAASIEIEDGPDSQGEMFTRPGRPSDHFKNPYPNDNAATAANGGAYPPDLSLMTKARHNGENYVFTLLLGYREPPEGVHVREGLHYNPYFPGGAIGMPKQLQVSEKKQFIFQRFFSPSFILMFYMLTKNYFYFSFISQIRLYSKRTNSFTSFKLIPRFFNTSLNATSSASLKIKSIS